MLERGRGLMRETGTGEFRVADVDLLEILDTPQTAVGAYAAQIESRDPERFGADFTVPGVEPSKIKVGIAIRELAGLDRVRVVHEEQENVPVRCVERGRLPGDIDMRVVGHAAPVERSRHLPARVADAIAGKGHHRLDQFPVEDPAIFRSGRRAQFGATILGLEQFDLLAPVVDQPMLQVDAGKRGRQLAQIRGRGTDETCYLAKGPVSGCKRSIIARRHQHQPLWIVAFRLDPDRPAFNDTRGRTVRAAAHGIIKTGQREIFLIVRTGEPLGRYAAAHASA